MNEVSRQIGTGESEPAVSIVILNWNSYRDTMECIESLKKVNYTNYQILVVDNGSTDGSARVIRSEFPDVTLIENEKNLGFAGGNNVGMQCALRSGAKYVLLLNQDTVVDSNFLRELVKVAESDSQIGAVQSKILKKENSELIDSLGQVWFPLRGPKDFKIGQPDHSLQATVHDIFGACAAAVLLRREVLLKVGLFDELFFCLFEDVDLSWRIRLAKYRIVLAPRSIVYHKRRLSGGLGSKSRYYAKRNQLYLVTKYYSLGLILIFLPFFFFQLIEAIYYSYKTGHRIIMLIRGVMRCFQERKLIQANPLLRQIQRKWMEKAFSFDQKG